MPSSARDPMSEVRDRPQIDLGPEMSDEVAPRRSLVARVTAPLRRASGRSLVPVGHPGFQTEREPRDFTRLAVILSFIVLVALPVATAGIYLFAIASDQYVAEARFAVRTADASGANDGVVGQVSLGGTLLNNGTNLISEDAAIIASFIHSRSAIEAVSQSVDVRAIFRRPEADFWARLPRDASAEKLTRYWAGMVGVYIEASSGIVQVDVRAFRKEDALALGKAILAASETLANSLNVKMQADQTRLAQDEVRRAEGNVRFALADLTAFRNAQKLIDPVQSAESTGKLLMQLMSDKIETEARLFVTQQTQGNSAPGIAVTKARLESINGHITELQNELASKKEVDKTVAASLARYEELEIKKGFAEKMFDFAREGLERSRLAAMRQSIYLAVFVPPSLPQTYSFPERWADLLLVAIIAFMTWASGAVVTASVLDHRL